MRSRATTGEQHHQARACAAKESLQEVTINATPPFPLPSQIRTAAEHLPAPAPVSSHQWPPEPWVRSSWRGSRPVEREDHGWRVNHISSTPGDARCSLRGHAKQNSRRAEAKAVIDQQQPAGNACLDATHTGARTKTQAPYPALQHEEGVEARRIRPSILENAADERMLQCWGQDKPMRFTSKRHPFRA